MEILRNVYEMSKPGLVSQIQTKPAFCATRLPSLRN